MVRILTNLAKCLRAGCHQPAFWLAILIAVVGGYRLTTLAHGHFYDLEERCYLQAVDAWNAIGRSAHTEAAEHLFVARGDTATARPGYALISMIPLAAQHCLQGVGAHDLRTFEFYDFACAFNVVASIILLLLVYRLSSVWANGWWGFVAACGFSATWFANMWLNHLVPYTISLSLLLGGLYVVCNAEGAFHRSRTTRVALCCGMLTALGFTCYPGYYAFLILNFVAVTFLLRPRVLASGCYALGGLVVFTAFECLSWAAGRSYLFDLRNLSRTIRQGDYSEGLVFGWRYLRDVEGLLGVALLLGAALLLLQYFRNANNGRLLPVAVVTITALTLYMFHGAMSVFAERMVFYGRVFGAYLPLLVVAATVGFATLPYTRARRFASVTLVVIAGVQFVGQTRARAGIQYPADFLFESAEAIGIDLPNSPFVLWGIDTGRPGFGDTLSDEWALVSDALPKGSPLGWLHVTRHARIADGRPKLIAANVRWVPCVRDHYAEFTAPPGYRFVAFARGPWSLPAYQYEGRKPWERRRIRDRGYELRMYAHEDVLALQQDNFERTYRDN